MNQTFTNNLFTFNNMFQEAPAQGRANPTGAAANNEPTATAEPDEPVNPPNETPINPEPVNNTFFSDTISIIINYHLTMK